MGWSGAPTSQALDAYRFDLIDAGKTFNDKQKKFFGKTLEVILCAKLVSSSIWQGDVDACCSVSVALIARIGLQLQMHPAAWQCAFHSLCQLSRLEPRLWIIFVNAGVCGYADEITFGF